MNKLLESISRRVWMEGDPSKDHTTGLIIFGTVEVLLGIFCFSLAMLLLIVVSVHGLHGMKPVHFWMTPACFPLRRPWGFSISPSLSWFS